MSIIPTRPVNLFSRPNDNNSSTNPFNTAYGQKKGEVARDKERPNQSTSIPLPLPSIGTNSIFNRPTHNTAPSNMGASQSNGLNLGIGQQHRPVLGFTGNSGNSGNSGNTYGTGKGNNPLASSITNPIFGQNKPLGPGPLSQQQGVSQNGIFFKSNNQTNNNGPFQSQNNYGSKIFQNSSQNMNQQGNFQNSNPFSQSQSQQNQYQIPFNQQNQQQQQPTFFPQMNQQFSHQQQQQQPNMFSQQGLPATQPNGPIGNSMGEYLNHFLRFQDAKSQHYGQAAIQMQGQQIPLHPSQMDPNSAEYAMFLNNIYRSQPVRQHATHKQLFQYGEDWANRLIPPPEHQLYATGDPARREQITKLFDNRLMPFPSSLQQKDMPPVEMTLKLLDDVEEPWACKIIISDLWQKCRIKFEDLLKTMTGFEKKTQLLKQLPNRKQALILYTEIKTLENSLKKLCNKEQELTRATEKSNAEATSKCKYLKQIFTQVNRNNQMIENTNSQLQMMTEYVQEHLVPLLKKPIYESQITFEDPDTFTLQIAGQLLNRVESLNMMLDNQLVAMNSEHSDAEPDDLLLSLCQFYQTLTSQLYKANQKLRKCINVLARKKNYENSETIFRKIEEKAGIVLEKRMCLYNKINDIEKILSVRGPFIPVNKEQTRNEVGERDAIKPPIK